ncbi:hypothetical protein RRSWK_02434 [Rhodopirellula sp. SWK7]|nr:hypothetical protein RRSWK_02434 [Rhodopirellula sp. SWK7]
MRFPAFRVGELTPAVAVSANSIDASQASVVVSLIFESFFFRFSLARYGGFVNLNG